MGPQRAPPGPDFQIGAELGQQHGGNLFHSFRDFNIGQGESATFTGPDSINTIISRVTGGQASEINGVLRSEMPDADLYLLNPAGLMFGPSAVLDVPGGFHASTADTVKFEDNTEFSARDPAQSSFTSAAPTAFGFLGQTPAPLTIRGSYLRTSEGKTLSLSGGNPRLEQAEISVSGGRLALIGVAGPGEVAGETVSAPGGEVSLRDSHLISMGEGGGKIVIRGGHFALHNSQISMATLGAVDGEGIDARVDSLKATGDSRLTSITLGPGKGGNITFHAKGSVEFSGAGKPFDLYDIDFMDFSGISAWSASMEQPEAGDTGSVHFKARELILRNGAIIGTFSAGTGQSSPVSMEVTDSLLISDKEGHSVSGIIAVTAGQGSSGGLTLRAGNLEILGKGLIDSSTLAEGRGGDLTLTIRDGIRIDRAGAHDEFDLGTGIFSTTEGTGDAGDLHITADNLDLLNKGEISSSTFGQGGSGRLRLDIAGHLGIFGEAIIYTSTYDTFYDNGDAGDLDISAGRLEMSSGGTIDAGANGLGNGGQLNIRVKDTLRLSGGYSVIHAGTNGSGEAGALNISTGNLEMVNGGIISAGTRGRGRGGNLRIVSRGPLELFGQDQEGYNDGYPSIFVGSMVEQGGKAGSLTLEAPRVSLGDGAEISSQTQGAEAGDIVIKTPGYLYLKHGKVETQVPAKQGDGGNIAISPGFIILDHGRINANAYEGDGGNILIQTHGIYQFDSIPQNESITASSAKGISGEIKLDSPDVDISGSLTVQSHQFINAESLARTDCTARQMVERSHLIVKRYPGRRAAPNDWRDSGCPSAVE